MTTQSTQSENVSVIEQTANFQGTEVLVFGSDGSSRSITSKSIGLGNASDCVIYRFEAVLPPEKASFSDFDDLVQELEGSHDSANQLKDARKWVGQKFYSETTNIATLRLLKGLSQKQLGLLCELEQSHISRYECGKVEPSLSIAKRIAEALEVDLEAFYAAWENTSRSACLQEE